MRNSFDLMIGTYSFTIISILSSNRPFQCAVLGLERLLNIPQGYILRPFGDDGDITKRTKTSKNAKNIWTVTTFMTISSAMLSTYDFKSYDSHRP